MKMDKASELYNDLVCYIMDIMDYMLRSQKKARKEMSKMSGKILESFSERERKKAQRNLHPRLRTSGKDLNQRN